MKSLRTSSIKFLAVSLAILISQLPRTAHATTYTYSFAGTVASVDAGLTGISAGDPLNGSYTFDDSVAARAGSDSTFSVFDALTALDFTAGSYSGALPSGAAGPEIQVDNNPGGGNHDRYAVVSRASDGLTGPTNGGQALSFFSFRLDDATDSVFSDALILPTDLSFGSFSSSLFFIFFQNPGEDRTPFVVSGSLNSLQCTDGCAVPEPTSVSLLLLGVAGLFGAKRTSRN